MIKKRLQSLFAAVMVAFGSVPLLYKPVYADTDAISDEPASEKNLINNNDDGTYTIALSVTGETASSQTTDITKANVVLVVDTSTSMTLGSGSGNTTRLEAEKDALTKTMELLITC